MLRKILRGEAKVERVWGISLILIGLSVALLAIANICGAELPDMLVRVLGIVDLVSLPVLAYSTIQIIKKNT